MLYLYTHFICWYIQVCVALIGEKESYAENI